MIANVTPDSQNQSLAIGASTLSSRPSVSFRAAKRSFCHVQELPLGRGAESSFFDSPAEPDAQPQHNRLQVRVAGFPSADRACCHQLFVELGVQLKKLDLASTRRVDVRQLFHAEAGDQLSFDCVMLLKSGSGFGSAANVQTVVVNLRTKASEVLLDHTIDTDRNTGSLRIGSNTRESLSLPILVEGEYELRTITSIDPMCWGAEAHLLIDSVRVTDVYGTEKCRLASLSCVGRVKR